MAALALLAVLAISRVPDSQSSQQSQPAVDPAKAAALAATCENVVTEAKKARVVLGRPDARRIDVDEMSWAMLPADAKRGLLKAVRCVALGGDPTRYGTASAYGYRSGKRLAQATSVGVTFD